MHENVRPSKQTQTQIKRELILYQIAQNNDLNRNQSLIEQRFIIP